MGPLRGVKRDVWEGGHRVPFVASWPSFIAPGTTSNALVSLSDLFATCVDLLDESPDELPYEPTEFDSESMLPALRGDDAGRSSLVLHSASGSFALRQGPWLLIDNPTGGDNAEPEWFRAERGYVDHDEAAELYNLDHDLGEAHNVLTQEADRAAEMSATLIQLIGDNNTRRADDQLPTTE